MLCYIYICTSRFEFSVVPGYHLWLTPSVRPGHQFTDRLAARTRILVENKVILPRVFGRGPGRSRVRILIGPTDQYKRLKFRGLARQERTAESEFKGMGPSSGAPPIRRLEQWN